MSTNQELVLRAEQASQQVSQNKVDIQAMVTKLEQVQAPAIASAKENIKQALIEKGQIVDDSVPFSEYGNKVRAIENGSDGGSNGTLIYMPLNGNLTAYGDLKYAFISPLEESPWGEGTYGWNPTYDEGVFAGEQALSFRATPMNDEGYPMEENGLRYVNIPIRLNVAEKDFTIDLWVRPDPLSGIANTFVIGGYVCVGIRSIGSSYQFNFDGGFANRAFPNGLEQWYHMALVRSGNKVYGFVNGVKVGEKEAPASFSSSSYGEGAHTGRSEGEPVFRVAHLRILNHALWTSGFTPPTQASYSQFMQ